LNENVIPALFVDEKEVISILFIIHDNWHSCQLSLAQWVILQSYHHFLNENVIVIFLMDKKALSQFSLWSIMLDKFAPMLSLSLAQ
jgi:hypothetical protein